MNATCAEVQKQQTASQTKHPHPLVSLRGGNREKAANTRLRPRGGSQLFAATQWEIVHPCFTHTPVLTFLLFLPDLNAHPPGNAPDILSWPWYYLAMP